MNDSLVIIPTYNEKENVEKMLRKVFSLPQAFDVLIVDDGSPDGTAAIVQGLQNEFTQNLHLMQRSGKLGLGTAYIAGFKWAIEKGYDYVIEMDCDFSHNPDDLLRLRQACVDGADLSVGSRYTRGGAVRNWPFIRVLISRGASLYVNMITWMGVADPTAGFVCYKSRVLDSINLDIIRFVGYAFQIEMKFAARKLGFNLVEVPITFIDRVEGYSKMTRGIIKEAVLGVIALQWVSFFRSYKKA